jgi:hypothetical protein
VALRDDLERVAAVAGALADEGERVAAVLPTEPARGVRGYLCAYEGLTGSRSWLALDDHGRAVTERRTLRDVVSIAALCEIAEENAGGGDLEALVVRLEALRGGGRDEEIDAALEAIGALQRELGQAPQLATPARLDAIGVATRRLEVALDPAAGSPFAAAMRAAQGAVDELTREVEARYRVELSG